MALTYSELLAGARSRIPGVGLSDLLQRTAAGEALVLVDVREPSELVGGRIPGALSVPRSALEQQIEERVPDRAARIVVYCAGGVRSALAAATLADLGYAHVERADPGFSRWKELGYPVEAASGLSDAQRVRYARHLRLREVGESGQAKLLQARVLIVGAGGLGSPVALYLAAAGVGTLGIVDADTVDASNLQRQIVHATRRIGAPKVESVAQAIAELNPDVNVIGHAERLTSGNVERLLAPYDLVIDGSDNFPTRYVVSDASVRMGKPVVHGAISRFEGQVTTFVPARAAARFGVPHGPCYRCLFPAPPPAELAPNCEQAGVLGVICGVVGSLQATEALKLLLGQGELLTGRLLLYDSMNMRFRELKLPKMALCVGCGDVGAAAARGLDNHPVVESGLARATEGVCPASNAREC